MWHVPVVPATQEAEAELLEPRRRRLQSAKIVPVHSRLDDRVRLRLKNKNKTIKQKTNGQQIYKKVLNFINHQKHANQAGCSGSHLQVIPILWEAEVGESLEVRSLKPAWPTW